MKWIADFLIWLAQKKVYRKGHLYHDDGSLYMKRFCLFETKWLSARVHHIVTKDSDRHMHDHPWSFLSYVLRGSYEEVRPIDVEPCFDGNGSEYRRYSVRQAGSWAFRRATDRHAIIWISQSYETWTLFIYGPIRQWWGFFTPSGKVYWKDYIKDGRSGG